MATYFLNVTCQDASRIYSSVDMDLPEGVRANTSSHCNAPLKLIFGRFIVPAQQRSRRRDYGFVSPPPPYPSHGFVSTYSTGMMKVQEEGLWFWQ